VIAHVGAFPLEEILPSVTGVGAGLALASHVEHYPSARQREPGS
jgi:hypothetical protein